MTGHFDSDTYETQCAILRAVASLVYGMKQRFQLKLMAHRLVQEMLLVERSPAALSDVVTPLGSP